MKLDLDLLEKQDHELNRASLGCSDSQLTYYMRQATDNAVRMAKLRQRIDLEKRKQKAKRSVKKYVLGPDGKPFSLEGRLAETIETGRKALAAI